LFINYQDKNYLSFSDFIFMMIRIRYITLGISDVGTDLNFCNFHIKISIFLFFLFSFLSRKN
jgi:hypothetical protein